MAILPALATQFQSLLPATDHGQERWRWFLLTLQAIPGPLTAGRLLIGVDDCINPKTGRKLCACQKTFDHAAKTNQSPVL